MALPNGNWRPSRKEQALLWYLALTMRFVVGGGGLIWETVIDELRNPMALLVFGTLATATDIVGFARSLIRQAREDQMMVNSAIDEREEKERE